MNKNYVTLPYDLGQKPLKWAKQNCPSYITNRAHPAPLVGYKMYDNSKIDYFFSDEKDMLMFAMRWQ